MIKEETKNLKAQVAMYRQASTPTDYAWMLLSIYMQVREGCDPDVAAKKAAAAVEDHLRCIDTEYDGLLRIYMEL